MYEFQFQSVGWLESPYREKFAVPRQPGLVTEATATIHFEKSCNREEILRGIDGFSHIWLVFVFHQAVGSSWKPMVRPPRLGGNSKVGVFASRSPYRPNPVGLSVVELVEVCHQDGNWGLIVKGADLVDGTPILDIKPYIPYADSIPHATGGFAEETPLKVPVEFSKHALQQLEELKVAPEIKRLIEQVIAQQPQPAYHQGDKVYGMNLDRFNIRWKSLSGLSEVTEVKLAD